MVATPIGNLGDVTLRALDVLASADVIACEDTRVTAKLLTRHGIATPTTPYHDHNAEKARPKLIKRMEKGETVALVSDAGTPLVSDPGLKLVQACVDAEIPVMPLPGPSSVLAALVVSGLPTDRFLFSGFLPAKAQARRKALAELADVAATLVVMESAKRLKSALADMADVLGPRDAAVTRELTKMFEEVNRGPLDQLAGAYAETPPPKGEVVVVIGPPRPGAGDESDARLEARLKAALSESSLRDAVDRVTAETGAGKRRVYALALKVKDGTG